MVEGGARVVEGGPKVGEGGQWRWAAVPSMWAERDEPGALRSCLELAATIGKIILLSCAGFVCMEEGGREEEGEGGGEVMSRPPTVTTCPNSLTPERIQGEISKHFIRKTNKLSLLFPHLRPSRSLYPSLTYQLFQLPQEI